MPAWTFRSLSCLSLLGALLACEDAGLTKVLPVIEVTPSPIVLPATAVGLSAQTPFVVRNRGSIALEVSRVRLQGSSEFAVLGSTQALSLAPGEERPFALAFRPTSFASGAASLSFASNDPERPELVVPIEALRRTGPVLVACVASPDVGLTRRCASSSLAVDLGTIAVDATVTTTLALESVGDAPVDVSSLGIGPGGSPEFTLVAPPTPRSLAPGARMTALVRYAPTTPGTDDARIIAVSSDPLAPGKTLELRARATPKALCLTPGRLDFGGVAVGSSATSTITATACGGRNVLVNAVEVIEGGAAFEVSPLASPVPLAPVAGLGFVLSVRFRPGAVGSFVGRLRVRSDAGDAFVSLEGSSGTCDLRTSPPTLVFAEDGSKGLLVENAGARDCTLEAVSFAAGSDPRFSLDRPLAAPRILRPGESEVLSVSLRGADGAGGTPVVPSALVLGYAADGASGAQQVPLQYTGGGVPGVCVLVATPSTVNFGLVGLGVSAARTIALVNEGTAPCALAGLDVAPGSGAFTFQREGDLVVSPGGLVAGVVRFSSNTLGASTGTLRVDFAAATLTDVDIPLSATTLGPRLCITPKRVDFGDTPGATASVTLAACGTADVVVSGLRFDPVDSELGLDPAPPTPLTLPVGATQTVVIRYAPSDAIGDATQLVVSSNDAVEGEQRVLVTAGAVVPEVCNNGVDEDGDGFIDEDCVPDRAIGRAVVFGQGRLFVWGDEHAKYEQYGAAPAAFWRGVFRWLSCEGCPGPRRTRIGDLNAQLNPLMRAEARALGLTVVDARGPSADVDALLVVANNASPDPALRPWVEAGGALMIMAVGIGPGECESSLDPFTAGFPLSFDCTDPNPFGPVGRFLPHPISFGLPPSASPFVNGRFVAEVPGTHSTVIALP
jgi:hypothetical protein